MCDSNTPSLCSTPRSASLEAELLFWENSWCVVRFSLCEFWIAVFKMALDFEVNQKRAAVYSTCKNNLDQAKWWMCICRCICSNWICNLLWTTATCAQCRWRLLVWCLGNWIIFVARKIWKFLPSLTKVNEERIQLKSVHSYNKLLRKRPYKQLFSSSFDFLSLAAQKVY